MISTTKGDKIIVDDSDYHLVSEYKWCVSRGYAVANTRKPDGKRTMLRMQRVIMKPRCGEHVDHINGQTLDNRRFNLRILTPISNFRSFQRKQKHTTSRFRGVSLHTQNNRWRATVGINNRQVSAGCYDTEEEAAMAYNRKAIEIGFLLEALNKVP